MATLTHQQMARLYDRIGPLLATQAFYENPACERLIEHGRFQEATCVFELGCGTGRLAEQLLERMQTGASYHGVDVSPAMVNMTRRRLERFGSRARVERCDGRAPLAAQAGAFDRFVSTYVFDLLSETDITAMLGEAHRLLVPGGRLCTATLKTAPAGVPRFITTTVARLHAVSPYLTGGCRPIELNRYLERGHWRVVHADDVVTFGVPSEVIVAEKV